MATTLPRSPRPSTGPPNMALPAIPKTRKASKSPPSMNRATATQTPQKSGLRTPSANSALPQIRTTPGSRLSTPGSNGSSKTVRKQISINSFPQPPKGVRTSSLPPSPLSAGTTPLNGISERLTASQRNSSDSSSLNPKPALRRKPSTIIHSSADSPSLLNPVGETNFISSGPGARGSDGLLSLPSPPQSRSSSAQGSYSTSATNYDEQLDGARGRQVSSDSSDKLASRGEAKGNVLVSVRVRPDATRAIDKSADGEWIVDGRRSLVSYHGKESGDYFYDNVFTTNDNNARVYDSLAKRLVRRVMEGYHGTVFAYGMTGTGKTFSMQGTTTSPGVIPLAITDIFSYIRETPAREFLLRVSYLEIYNEKIHDLLTESSGTASGEEIKLREDAKRGVYATPLKEEIVQSPTQLLRVIARGDHARRTSSTQFNSRSSRSHAVVQIVVESRERGATGQAAGDKRSGIVPGGVRVSTLSLIDLAGSERAAENKERRTEGSHINKSLLTLGTVIARLSGDKDKDGKPTDKDGKHLPYRDSKLTRLLQGALSGDSLVSILCTLQIGSMGSAGQASTHTNETLNTLKFASRAKNNIVSHAKKAEEALGAGGDGGARVLLERYRLEILELRAQIDSQAKIPDEEEEKQREKEAEIRREEQMLEMQLARTALKERIDHLNRLILSSKSIGVNGTYSSLSQYPRLSTMTSSSQLGFSNRMSLARSEASTRKSLERSASVVSTSTLGQLPAPKRQSTEERYASGNRSQDSNHSDEATVGNASLHQQNQALQSDLANKNRYISTLERRLLQARRSSTSRTSVNIHSGNRSPSKTSIMVGEDHGISTLLKDKDAEIAELRASLEDKDRMLAALRNVARSRTTPERRQDVSPGRGLLPDSPTSPRRDSGSDLEGDLERLSPTKGLVELRLLAQGTERSLERTKSAGRGSARRVKSVDEMSRMLDEMIQDKVEQGLLVKNTRGSFRVAKRESSFGPVTRFPSVSHGSTGVLKGIGEVSK